MQERKYNSVKEYFLDYSPELVEFLEADDLFWKQINDNSISEEELEVHEVLLAELGMNRENSEIAKAVWLIKEGRKRVLPTPIKLRFG